MLQHFQSLVHVLLFSNSDIVSIASKSTYVILRLIFSLSMTCSNNVLLAASITWLYSSEHHATCHFLHHHWIHYFMKISVNHVHLASSNLDVVISIWNIMVFSSVIAFTKQTRYDPISAKVKFPAEWSPTFWHIDGKFNVQCARSMACNGALSWVHKPLNGAYDLNGWGFSTINLIYFSTLLSGLTICYVHHHIIGHRLHHILGTWYLYVTLKRLHIF